MIHAGFMQAILDAPDDDTPRLVYADWLEEQGEAARAEFIRVQCELARLPKQGEPIVYGNREVYLFSRWNFDLQRDALEAREKELLAANSFADFPGYIEEWWFRRGFVECVRLKCDDFCRSAGALLEMAPTLREVRLSDKQPNFIGVDYTSGVPEPAREWRWHTDYAGDESALPLGLFQLLKGGHPLEDVFDVTSFSEPTGTLSVMFGRSYDSEAGALADLSDACLAYARDQLK